MSQAISQKFQPTTNEPILYFVSGSTVSAFEDSENITNNYRPEFSKIQNIKYFEYSDTIRGFSNLKNNWDSYNADVISKNAINTAIEILNHLSVKGQLSNDFSINVFPMRDGGIQFEFDGKNICAELEINQNGDSTFIRFDDDGNILNKDPLFELSELSALIEEAQYA